MCKVLVTNITNYTTAFKTVLEECLIKESTYEMLLMKKRQAANVREGTLSEMGPIPPQKEEAGAGPDWGGGCLQWQDCGSLLISSTRFPASCHRGHE